MSASRTIVIVYAALEALGDRDPGAVSADELLAAVPETSAAEFAVAAKFLERLASRLKGAAWRIDSANSCFLASQRGRAQAHTRAREET
jgi:hypothetical protein